MIMIIIIIITVLLAIDFISTYYSVCPFPGHDNLQNQDFFF